VKVTLPFGEFQDKIGKGPLTSEAAANVTGFGLWLNAIGDSPAIDSGKEVSGILYYDDIRAVSYGKTRPDFEVTGQDSAGADLTDPGETAGKETEETGETEEAAEAVGKVSWIWYILPAVTGLIALAAAGCFVALVLGGKKRRK